MIKIFKQTEKGIYDTDYQNHIVMLIHDFSNHFNDEIQSEFNFLNDSTFLIDESNETEHSTVSTIKEGNTNTKCKSSRENEGVGSWESLIKDYKSIIIGWILACINGDGGDSGIPKIMMKSLKIMMKSLRIDTLASDLLHHNLHYIDGILNYMLTKPMWVYNLYCIVISCHILYRFYCFCDLITQFDSKWSLIAFRPFSYPTENPDTRLNWAHFNPPSDQNRWFDSLRNSYGINRLRKIMRSLRLNCINSLQLSDEIYHKTYGGMGIKSLLNHSSYSFIIRVTTKVFDPQTRKYIYSLSLIYLCMLAWA